MSKRFEVTYPNLASAIKNDLVMALTNEDGEGIYIGYGKDGKEVELGRIGYESTLEAFLKAKPSPEMWV